MATRSTEELNALLENVHPDNMPSFLAGHRADISNTEKRFYYYFKDVIETKGILLKDVYTAAGMGESYGGKILRMEKHTSNRDAILRLLLAGHFSQHEANRALKLYGMAELYPRDGRDACLIVAFHSRRHDINDVNDMLEKNGYPILGTGKD